MLSQRMKRDNLKTGVGVCVPVQTGKCPWNKRLKKFNSHSMQLNINDLYYNLIFAFVGYIFFLNENQAGLADLYHYGHHRLPLSTRLKKQEIAARTRVQTRNVFLVGFFFKERQKKTKKNYGNMKYEI